MRAFLVATSLAFAVLKVANADVNFTVPDGSTVIINGVPDGGGGTTPPPDGGGGGTEPPPDGGGTTPPPDVNAACLENLHAEKMYDHGALWTMGGAAGTSPLKDGVAVGGGGSQFVCSGGNIWMKGDDNTYYVWNGSIWTNNRADPTIGKTWPLLGVTGTSPNGTKGFQITDSYGNKWKFCNGSKVCRNDVVTNGDGSTIQLYNNGIYVVGGNGSWYIWTGAVFWPWGPDPSAITPPPTFGPVQPPQGGGTTPPPGGGGGTSGENLPVPNPPTTLPGSSGRVLQVAAGASIASVMATAQPGDTVELAEGVYPQNIVVSASVLLKGKWTSAASTTNPRAWFDVNSKRWIKGSPKAGGSAIDCSSVGPARGKACVVLLKDAKIQGVEIYGAGMNEGQSGGTACVRVDADGYAYVEMVYAHDCQNGIFGGGYSNAWDIKDTILDHNGLGDGFSHNFYITAGKVTIVRMVSRNPNNGHAAKLRGQDSTISDSSFDGGSGGSSLDFPDGGHHVMTNVSMSKPAGAPSHNVLFYAEESGKYGIPGANFTGGSVAALCDSPQIVTTGPVTFSGTTFTGNPISVTGGGSVTGMPGSRGVKSRVKRMH